MLLVGNRSWCVWWNCKKGSGSASTKVRILPSLIVGGSITEFSISLTHFVLLAAPIYWTFENVQPVPIIIKKNSESKTAMFYSRSKLLFEKNQGLEPILPLKDKNMTFYLVLTLFKLAKTYSYPRLLNYFQCWTPSSNLFDNPKLRNILQTST